MNLQVLTPAGVRTIDTGAGAATNPHDVRNFGAVSAANGTDPNAALVDCAPAFYAAVDAFHRDPLQPAYGAVYWPEGDWYIGMPLQIGEGITTMYGDGYKLSRIRVGPGTDATPNLVQGFAGPAVVYAGFDQTGLQYPSYGAPLVGVTGRSLNLAPGGLGTGSPMLILTESWPWCGWLYSGATQLTLRMWVNVPNYGLNLGGDILTCVGPLGYLDSSPGPNRQDITLSLSAIGLGGSPSTAFRAILTTYNSGQKTITSSTVSAGTHYLALVYDGAHFDLFVDGISQGSVAMTGNVKSTPWELKCIGGSNANPITGRIDSIELAQVARYTPGVNFTPPTSKHTADSNTMWLANWDQGDPVPGQAWAAIAQSKLNSGAAGMVKHYLRSIQWESNGLAEYFTRAYGFGLFCGHNASGIIALNSPWSYTHDVFMDSPAGFGFYLPSNTSFFGTIANIAVDQCMGIGITMAGNGTNLWTRYCAIGQKLQFGDFRICYDQPFGVFPFASYIPFVLGAGAGDSFSTLFVRNASVDDEGSFVNQQTACLVVNGSNATMVLENNGWSALGSSPSAPAITYAFVNPSPTEVLHIGDQFYSDQSGVETAHFSYGATNSVKWINCGTPFRGTMPLSNLPEDYLIEQYTAGRHSLQQSVSTSGVQGNNLAGEFTIGAGSTVGGPIFATQEPDANYEVVVTYRGHKGSVPAANSWLPSSTGITTRKDGFDFTVQADPAGTSLLIFSYVIIRTPAPPLIWDYAPTLPSTYTNPLPAGPFFVGMTLTPTSGHCFIDEESLAYQTVVEAGTAAPNFWDLELLTGFVPRTIYGGTQVGINGSFVDANGKLAGLINPGPHNVAFGIKRFVPGAGINVGILNIDGSEFDLQANMSAGTQQTPIRLGQHSGGTHSLTSGTVKDFKVDDQLYKVQTLSHALGPQVGMTESAFMGDSFIVGRAPDTGGGFASQIASTKYGAGTYYYWLAANDFVTAQDLISTNIGIPNAFWGRWGALKTPVLNSLVIMVGFYDLSLFARTAATVWPQIQQLVNGVPASSSFFPAGVNTPSKTIYDPPCTGGLGSTASLTVNGVSFTPTNLGTTPSGNAGEPSVDDLISQFNANPGGILSVCTPSKSYNATFDQWDLILTSVATGFGSEAIPVVYDSANGSKGFPPSPTQFLNPAGTNDTITIAGHTVDAKTLATQDLTINNIITNINAVPALVALITASLDTTTTPHSLKIVANSPGAAGNAITVSCSTAGTSFWAFEGQLFPHLAGGVDGAVQLGIPNIVLCTVPPFFPATYTPTIDAERNSLNTSIRAFTATGLHIADVDVTIRDPAAHQNVKPAFLNGANTGLNAAAHTALVALINPLLP